MDITQFRIKPGISPVQLTNLPQVRPGETINAFGLTVCMSFDMLADAAIHTNALTATNYRSHLCVIY